MSGTEFDSKAGAGDPRAAHYEQRSADEALHASEERFHRLLDAVTDYYWQQGETTASAW